MVCTCAVGWFGAECSEWCRRTSTSVDGPEDLCTGPASCDQLTGTNVSCPECQAGSYGTRCDKRCQDVHTNVTTCISPISCNKEAADDASCTECERGFSGTVCGDDCDVGNCVESLVSCNQRDKSDVQVSGISRCDAGHFKVSCLPVVISISMLKVFYLFNPSRESSAGSFIFSSESTAGSLC